MLRLSLLRDAATAVTLTALALTAYVREAHATPDAPPALAVPGYGVATGFGDEPQGAGLPGLAVSRRQ